MKLLIGGRGQFALILAASLAACTSAQHITRDGSPASEAGRGPVEEMGLLGEWSGEVTSGSAGPTRMELSVESVGGGHIQGQQRFIVNGLPGATNSQPMKWIVEGNRITSSSGMWELIWDGKDTISGICNCPSRQAEVRLRRRK